MTHNPIITLALFHNWKKLVGICVPFVLIQSISRKMRSESEESLLDCVTDTAFTWFQYLSLMVGGAVMIDHLSLVQPQQIMEAECPFELPIPSK